MTSDFKKPDEYSSTQQHLKDVVKFMAMYYYIAYGKKNVPTSMVRLVFNEPITAIARLNQVFPKLPFDKRLGYLVDKIDPSFLADVKNIPPILEGDFYTVLMQCRHGKYDSALN